MYVLRVYANREENVKAILEYENPILSNRLWVPKVTVNRKTRDENGNRQLVEMKRTAFPGYLFYRTSEDEPGGDGPLIPLPGPTEDVPIYDAKGSNYAKRIMQRCTCIFFKLGTIKADFSSWVRRRNNCIL